MKFTYYGHAAFSLSDETTTILFDPFITDNPWTSICPADIDCQYVVLTHAHGDHYGDVEAIAKKNDALVVSTAEVAGKAAAAGCRAHAMHVGGSASFPFGTIRLTPAFHGSGVEGGMACGVIVEFGVIEEEEVAFHCHFETNLVEFVVPVAVCNDAEVERGFVDNSLIFILEFKWSILIIDNITAVLKTWINKFWLLIMNFFVTHFFFNFFI